MFLGNHTTSKRINLGNSKTISTQELLLRNKRARELRLQNDRRIEAIKVIIRFLTRTRLKRLEYQKVKDVMDVRVYSLYFYFITTEKWIEFLNKGYLSPRLLKRLSQLSFRLKNSRFDNALYNSMVLNSLIDYSFCKRLLSTKDQKVDMKDVIDYCNQKVDMDIQGYCQFILTIPGIVPPKQTVPFINELLFGNSLDKSDKQILFLNSLRMGEYSTILEIIQWGLLYLDLFDVYKQHDDMEIEDRMNPKDRELVDALGTVDFLKSVTSHKLMGLILYRYETKRVELGSWLVFHIYDELFSFIKGYTNSLTSSTNDTYTNSLTMNTNDTRDSDTTIPWDEILLYCDLDGRVLSTSSQDEFFSRDLTMMETLSGKVKGLLQDLMFAKETAMVEDGTVYDDEYKIQVMGKWLSMIRTRDSISPFCSANHWLFDFYDLKQILESVPLFDSHSRQNVETTSKVVKLKRVLETIPFVIPFEDRVWLFRRYVDLSHGEDGWMQPHTRAKIRRSYLFEDGFAQLNLPIRGRIAIEFIDEHGIPEVGIDGGGVFKEFLVELMKRAFDERLGLFMATRDGKVYPATTAYAMEDDQLQVYMFLGRMVGKALVDGVLLDRLFARFFLSKWIGKRSYFYDLPELDLELYNGLVFLKRFEGDVEDLALTMSLTLDQFGTKQVVELKPGGSKIPITNHNRVEYIYLTAHHRLNTQMRKQCTAFFAGLSELVSPEWLKMFNEEELQILIGGSEVPIDVRNLKEYTTYGGVFDPGHPTIKLFWEVIEEMSQKELKLLIKFITSVPRPPLLGFKELQPPLCIRFGGQEQDRLPSASTCVNLLKLPAYTDKQNLKEKLGYAIRDTAGFGLS